MKPAYALSWHQFCATLQNQSIDDSNIESNTSAVIEIMGEQDLVYMPFHFREDHPNVLRLLFDDIEKDLQVERKDNDGKEYIPVLAMTEEQGKKIVEFVRKNDKASNFIIHCAAGISRSGAIAKFINEVHGGDDIDFIKLNPYARPNPHILRVLRNLHQTIKNSDDFT